MPNKLLGQNFLTNKKVSSSIVAQLGMKANDIIVEIGPGHGALTVPLLKQCESLGCRVVAIEKDLVLANKLMGLEKDGQSFNLTKGDALVVLPALAEEFSPKPYKLIGNIPYYITGQLLRILSELQKKPELIVLMVQREVADRLMAKPPKNNLLAAITQGWSAIERPLKVSRRNFKPAPKVDSAVIKLIPNKIISDSDWPKYVDVCKMAFRQPRKTLYNNLSAGLGSGNLKDHLDSIFNKLGWDKKLRPAFLGVSDLLSLAKLIARYRS